MFKGAQSPSGGVLATFFSAVWVVLSGPRHHSQQSRAGASPAQAWLPLVEATAARRVSRRWRRELTGPVLTLRVWSGDAPELRPAQRKSAAQRREVGAWVLRRSVWGPAGAFKASQL